MFAAGFYAGSCVGFYAGSTIVGGKLVMDEITVGRPSAANNLKAKMLLKRA